MTGGKLLKIHKWWASHYGTMMAFVYVVTSLSPTPPSLATFLTTLGIFTVASVGIGSFGQLLNDLADIPQDLRSGSHNLVATKSVFARVAIFAAALAIGIVPWVWLPTTPAIRALIAAEYVLFAAYSLPPIRLKTRGILGAVADALYGYVVPNAVAVLLFARLANVEVPAWLLGPLVAWCFFFGLERILHHQLVDESRDSCDGITTFVVRRGWRQAFDDVLRIALPLAAASFVVLLVCLGIVAPLIPAFFVGYLVVALRHWAHTSVGGATRLERLPPVTRHYLVAELAIARFTWRWLPLLGLATLVAHRPAYLPVAVLHFLLFPEPVVWLWRTGVPEAQRLFRAA